ncbi:MAG: (2Fe-2S) ferredoxin domain-containing protein [Nitrospirae bacterium]|nr:(2Fe-2S) ferredoxin domain-containing protein [Nitrospirota bacterium]
MEQAMKVEKPSIKPYHKHLLVCTGPRCTSGESETLFKMLGEKLQEHGLEEGEFRVKRTRCSCFAVCRGGPIVVIQPDGAWYYGVTPEVLDRILKEHLKEGKPVQEHIFYQSGL